MRVFVKIALCATALAAAAVAAASIIISSYSSDRTSCSAGDLPACKVGLLLGTSAYLAPGKPNAYFTARIDAAVELYRSGKVRYLLVSGDNRTVHYNEPARMKEALLDKGIPPEAVIMDYGGLRTLDSVVRAKEIFGQDRLIVISQKFHNERAVYIAHAKGIEAWGYNAEDVMSFNGLKTKARELLARVKVFIDLALGVKPHFGGDPIGIG